MEDDWKLPSSDRLREIADLAEFVAEESWGDQGVDPLAVADAKGITVSFNNYGDAFDGLLEHKAGHFHIYGNLQRLERTDSSRARFTISHELGHYYIDEHRRTLEVGVVPSHPSFCDYESRNPVEREADHFASNLLLPERRFREAAASIPPGLAGVLHLAKMFHTSITSTAIRYASLNVKPCALVKWESFGVKWKWLSGSTREAGFRSIICDQSKLPLDCATACVFRGDTSPTGFLESGTTASAWFPRTAELSHRNIILIEQAISLGRFGILTFLYPHAGVYDFSEVL